MSELLCCEDMKSFQHFIISPKIQSSFLEAVLNFSHHSFMLYLALFVCNIRFLNSDL